VHQLRFNSPSFTTGNVTYNIATGGAREGKKREEKGFGMARRSLRRNILDLRRCNWHRRDLLQQCWLLSKTHFGGRVRIDIDIHCDMVEKSLESQLRNTSDSSLTSRNDMCPH